MLSQGTTIEVETTSGVWFKLGKAKTIGKPNPTIEQLEATHLESTAKEYEPGLPDFGEIPITLLVDDGGETDEYVEDWIDAQDKRNTRITGPTGRTRTFEAFPSSYSGNFETNTILERDLTLRVSGAVARSWGGS